MWFPWPSGFAQICEKWLVHQRVMVAQLQVVVSDSHQVDQNQRVGQSPVGVYTEVPECGLSRGAHMEAHALNSLWSMASPYFNGTYSYLLNRKDSGVMKGITPQSFIKKKKNRGC